MTTTNTAPLACDLLAFTPAEREAHIQEAAALRSKMIGFEKIPTGLRVYFASATPVERLRTFAERDRRCCAWLTGVAVSAEDNRKVLQLTTHPEGAAFWINLFMALPVAEKSSTTGRPLLKIGAIAAGLCLACLLPLAGGVLVARGLIPTGWNPGEGVYLALGGLVLAGWFGLKIRQRRKARATGAGCGC